MLNFFFIVGLILLTFSSSYAEKKEWFYSSTGPLFGGAKKAPITYTLLAPFTSTGIGSNSYNFNGTSHYVSVPDSDAYSSEAMGICGWVNPDTITGADTILAKYNAADSEWELSISGGQLRFIGYDDTAGGYRGRSYSQALPVDKWSFVCGTWDGGLAVTDFDVLVNCVAVDDGNITSGTFNGIINTASPVAIGSSATPGNYWDGTLMNVSFWNVALSDTGVLVGTTCESAMAASSYSTYTGSTTNLVSWWDLQSDVEDKHSTHEGTAQPTGKGNVVAPSGYENFITDGECDVAGAWSLTNATISGGKLNLSASATVSTNPPSFLFTSGRTYRLTYTIDSITPGASNIRPFIGTTGGTARTTTGTFVEDITWGGGGANVLYFFTGGAFTSGVVDNISVYDVTPVPAYPFKDSTNPVLLANGQVLDQSPDMWGVSKGSLTVVDTSTGTVSETGTTLSMAGVTGGYTATGAVSPVVTRALGTAFFRTINVTSLSGESFVSGFANANALTLVNQKYGVFYDGSGLHAYTGSTGAVYGTLSAGTAYKFVTLLGGFDTSGNLYKTGDTVANFKRGFFFLVKGGAFTNYTLLFNNSVSDATETVYATQSHITTAQSLTVDDAKIPITPISSAIFQPFSLDTFTGSNGDVLTAHTMDVGAGWTKRVADSVFDIDTNTAELETDGSDPLILPVTARYAYIPTVADGITDLTVKCDSTLNAQNGLFFRGKADGAVGMNGWAYVLQGDATNCDEYVYLYNNDGGTAIYSNAAGTLTNGTSYALGVQHIGNTIRMYRAGVKIGSDISNATHNDGTWTGIFTDTTSNTNTAFDLFSVFGAFTNGNGTAYGTFFQNYGY